MIFDSGTNLFWQNTPSSAGTWKEALAYCEDLEYAGYSDWRLPNKDELMTIVDFSRDHPASSFPDINAENYLLTSTTMPTWISTVFRLYTPLGSMDTTMQKTADELNSGYEKHVRCVRSDL